MYQQVGYFYISRRPIMAKPVFKFLQFSNHMYKAELLQECIVFLIRLFARAILLMKKLKIEKIKAT